MGQFFKALQDIADQVIDEYEKDILIPAIDMTIKDIQELLNQEVGKLIQDYYKKTNFSPTTYIRSNQLKIFQPLVMITPIYKTSDDYLVSFDADIEDQYTGEDLSQRMDHSSYQIRVRWKTKNGIKSKIYTVHRSAKAQETLSNQDLEQLIAGNVLYNMHGSGAIGRLGKKPIFDAFNDAVISCVDNNFDRLLQENIDKLT